MPVDEKKPSGQQNRKRRQSEVAEERLNEKRRRRDAAGEQSPRHKLPFPPIGDPLGGVAWVHDALLAMLWEVLHDEEITSEKRWRFVSELGAKVGMTHAKAHVQKRLKDLQKSDEPDHDEELEPNPLHGTNT